MTEQEAKDWRRRALAAEREIKRIQKMGDQTLGWLEDRERERDAARLETLETKVALAQAVRALQEKHLEAQRQFEHDRAHLLAEAAAHGRTKRWARAWKRCAKVRASRLHARIRSD